MQFHPTTVQPGVIRFRLRLPIAYSFVQGCVAPDARVEVPMAHITINDLPQSDALDREAMRSIVGGGLTGARPVQIDPAKAGRGRIVDYPPGFGRRATTTAKSKSPVG